MLPHPSALPSLSSMEDALPTPASQCLASFSPDCRCNKMELWGVRVKLTTLPSTSLTIMVMALQP